MLPIGHETSFKRDWATINGKNMPYGEHILSINSSPIPFKTGFMLVEKH